MSNLLNRALFGTGFALGAVGAYRYGEEGLRRTLLLLQASKVARQVVTDFPMAWTVASRFVAGESADDAMTVTRQLNDQGLRVSLDFLGESVTTRLEAAAARNEIIHLLDKIAENGVDANVSVKLTQLGLAIDPDVAHENMRLILQQARRHGNWVRIDMEDHHYTDITLQLYRRLRDEDGLPNTGVVIQSYLYRSAEDVEQLVAEGARVRLCKGAYAEPADLAYPAKADTDRNFVKLTQMLLSGEARRNGVVAGIATHDEKMIQATLDYVREHDIPQSAFEFQMLYGVRRELQASLRQQGYNVRVYVPYGTAWYPYFMRRLAERPANLWFFLSNYFKK